MDYEKLTEDLKDAMKAGVGAAALVADSGSCNLDGVMIRFGRGTPPAKVKQAFEAAGVPFAKTTNLFGSGYMINPVEGQADKRYAACKAVERTLRERNYTALHICITD